MNQNETLFLATHPPLTPLPLHRSLSAHSSFIFRYVRVIALIIHVMRLLNDLKYVTLPELFAFS